MIAVILYALILVLGLLLVLTFVLSIPFSLLGAASLFSIAMGFGGDMRPGTAVAFLVVNPILFVLILFLVKLVAALGSTFA